MDVAADVVDTAGLDLDETAVARKIFACIFVGNFLNVLAEIPFVAIIFKF